MNARMDRADAAMPTRVNRSQMLRRICSDLPSLRGLARAARRSVIELLLGLVAARLCASMLAAGEPKRALLVLCAGAASVLTGLLLLHRSGALLLALRCPRLEALGFRAGSRSAPWPALRAADDALRALDEEARGYREFFPDARRDLIAAAFRALESHRRLIRVQRALASFGDAATDEEDGQPTSTRIAGSAPSSSARKLLREQGDRADAELLALTRTLRDLRARFIASTAPQHSVPDALPSLQLLEQRTEALGEAGEQVQIQARSHS